MRLIDHPHDVVRVDDIPRIQCKRLALRSALELVGGRCLSYAGLESEVQRVAAGLANAHVGAEDRVAIYLPKGLEAVVAFFAVTRLNAVAVPINPALTSRETLQILQDCSPVGLITSAGRLEHIGIDSIQVSSLRCIVDCANTGTADLIRWHDLEGLGVERSRQADAVAAILYTSGSSGAAKGVVLTHQNMVLGAKSVASYLENHEKDRLLAALPLSFDAGLSQVTTALLAGGTAVLLDYLFAQDAARAIDEYAITGLTGVPTLWRALAGLNWKEGSGQSLRYFANTGGRMDPVLLARLRGIFPRAKPYLMYGLTEAFRSTYLPPEQADVRPESIGKAIPNAEVFVLRDDATECDPFEHGEIVHAGPLVSQGYWDGSVDSYAHFGPAPACSSCGGRAVWSGDLGFRDAEGFLYFVGRRDEIIKVSGHRVSPVAVEAAAAAEIVECCAFGVEWDGRDTELWLAAVPADPDFLPAGEERLTRRLLERLSSQLPRHAMPHRVFWRRALPKDPNGKINRRAVRMVLYEYQKANDA